MLFEAQIKVVSPYGEIVIPIAQELQCEPTQEQFRAIVEKAVQKAVPTIASGLKSADERNVKAAAAEAKKAATAERRAASRAVKAVAAAERKAAKAAERQEEKVQKALDRVLALLAALVANAKASPAERMIADKVDYECLESLVRDCVSRGVRDAGRVAFCRYMFRALYLRLTAIHSTVSIDEYKSEHPSLAKYETRVLKAGFNPITESKLASSTAKAA